MNTETIIFFVVGAAIGYYVSKHWMQNGTAV